MSVSKRQLDKDKELLLQSALPVGTLLQSKSRKYYVAEVLGGGGFGITYKVFANEKIGNISQRIFFVIKEYFIKGCSRSEDGVSVVCAPNMKYEFEQSRADFVMEADRLNKLGKLSPNIVKVNEHFDAYDTSYYVMEYLDGGDLRNYVKATGALSESEALSKMIPIARAVECLHKDGLLHLDIKPDNIVLKEDDETGEVVPVLIDFGIAKHFDRHGKPTSRPIAKGASDGYAPMEQYTEITKFAPEIDVYALGATLYFCLTSSNPPKAFDIPSNETLLAKLSNRITQRVKEAIVNAMQRSSYDRTKNVRSFLVSIEQVYTLPIGTELSSSTQKYRIIEVLGETPLYIKYKAVLSNGSKTNAINGAMENETTTLAQYYIYEWFEKGKDKRIDSTNVQKLDLGSTNNVEYESSSFAKEMHKLIPDKYFVEKDNYGRLKAEKIWANDTYYYVVTITNHIVGYGIPITFKRWLISFKGQIKYVVCVLLGIVLLGFMGSTATGLLRNKTLKTVKTTEEILQEAVANKDKGKLLVLAEDSAIQKAYISLAKVYLKERHLDSAINAICKGDTINDKEAKKLLKFVVEEKIAPLKHKRDSLQMLLSNEFDYRVDEFVLALNYQKQIDDIVSQFGMKSPKNRILEAKYKSDYETCMDLARNSPIFSVSYECRKIAQRLREAKEGNTNASVKMTKKRNNDIQNENER